MTIQTINPTTGEVLNTYQQMTQSEVNAIIKKVSNAQQQWSEFSHAARAEKMRDLISLMEQRKETYAKLITQEMGKPFSAAITEIIKCQWVCTYYADNTESLLTPRIIPTELLKSYVCYKPLGIIFAIMPWNFPFWQVFRFAAPNIMGGNAVLLSHAQINTGVSLAIEQLFHDAGFPAHLFRSLIIDHPTIAKVIHHPSVHGVTLTGSQRAGRSVGVEAGNALKKVVLELGGNDPYIILHDADIHLAAQVCVDSRLANSGQVCIAAKRLIVVDEIYDEFLQKILAEVDNYRMGNPMDKKTNMGPLARKDLREHVHEQVQTCIQQGATLMRGGVLPNTPGFFYPPTVLTSIKPGMLAMKEEIFGPVICIIRAKNEDEAITLANQTNFGLAAAVFTQDINRGEMIARDKIQAGTCFVNIKVSSDPRLPFGGINESGYGRELGLEGLREFMNIKTIGVE